MSRLSDALKARTETVLRDFAHAWRRLRNAPTYALTVVVTIAVGIGANATVLGIIDTAFVRKLPVPNPDNIVRIRCTDTTRAARIANSFGCSFPEWRDIEHVGGLDGLAGFTMTYAKLGGDLSGLEPYGSFVTGTFFSVLGVQPQRGRYFTASEADPADPRAVVVISDVLWKTALGADPGVVGRKIFFGTTPFTVLGVMPPGWTGLHPEGRADFWIPYTARFLATGKDDYTGRDAHVIHPDLVGRLSVGATLAQVQGNLDNAARDLQARYPSMTAKRQYRAALSSRMISGMQALRAISSFLVALMVVGLVHLVACSNVASLALARAAARRRELGMRMALGASRGRIALEAVAEPVLLATLGAAAGLMLSRWFTGLITSMWFMSALNPGLDSRAVAIVAVITAGTALLFGVGPVLTATRQDPMEVLRSATPTGRFRAGSPDSILIIQAALSVLLLAQSQLLVGKFVRENDAPLGFDDARIVTAQVQLTSNQYKPADWQQLYAAAVERASATPGVVSVSATTRPPLQFGSWIEPLTAIDASGASVDASNTHLTTIGPGYFATLGAAMKDGREFDASDRNRPDNAKRSFDVAVVNETFAKRFWPNGDAIGRTLTFRKDPVRIVGVVRDIKDVTLTGAFGRVYFPMLEFAYPRFWLVAKVTGNRADAAQRLRTALSGLPQADPPIVQTVEDARNDQLLTPRVLGLVLTGCAAVALLLTAIGLFGAVSMWAANRRSEIGVRLALGARAHHVYRLLMLGAGKFSIAGIGLGLVLSVALVKVERAGYGPTLAMDGLAIAIAGAVFIAVTTAAAFVPARRATRVPPSDVLRAQ